jgi:V/A-type H+-transporting ATPase subunit I
MLRPERMSRVSVTGHKRVMADVIEAVHDLNLVHLSEYDGSWAGFDPGDPIEGADEASDQLVTVRSIESILDVEELDAGPARVVADEFEDELESVRERVNELDDTRSEIRDELRALEEAQTAAEPFVDLGIDLDLLSGYDRLTVRVGEGDESAVAGALEAAGAVETFETFAGERTVAVFADAEGAAVDEALVGASFTAVEIPDAEGSPEAYIADLEHDIDRLEQRLRTVREELQELKLDAGRFLLAVEERLSIEVQKAEAPLSFATTDHAFVAEGWVPTDRLDELRAALDASAGDHVEVEELERADYDSDGVPEHAEAVTDGGDVVSKEVAADGGYDRPMETTGPPVIMDNPVLTRPFELLVTTIKRPRYTELDPTVLVWLTFPVFFGFMIGDLGYGAAYTLIGYAMWKRFDSPGLQSLGGVGMWAGVFTMLFGVLYGEVFGLHVLGEWLWGEHGLLLALGHPPIEKGLNASEFALLWLVTAMVVGLLHVGLGYGLGFINELRHSVKDAVLESGSWALLMFGVWVWILSRHLADSKPDFVFTLLGHGEEAVFALGFTGFPVAVGLAGLAGAAIGLVLMVYGEYKHLGGPALIAGPLESLQVLVNVLSYARITAVLLAKAGMAFVVNLLFFGAYEHHGETHFMHSTTPEHVIAEYGAEAVTFPGLIHGGAAAIVGGLLILVIGHATVLALGITSAGLQAVRLEYVEFFQKFYEGGGGEPYEPFGYGDRAGGS